MVCEDSIPLKFRKNLIHQFTFHFVPQTKDMQSNSKKICIALWMSYPKNLPTQIILQKSVIVRRHRFVVINRKTQHFPWSQYNKSSRSIKQWGNRPKCAKKKTYVNKSLEFSFRSESLWKYLCKSDVMKMKNRMFNLYSLAFLLELLIFFCFIFLQTIEFYCSNIHFKLEN